MSNFALFSSFEKWPCRWGRSIPSAFRSSCNCSYVDCCWWTMHSWTNARRFSFEIPLGLSSSSPMSAIVVWTSSEWPWDRRELFSASTSANLPLHILSYRMCLFLREDIVAAANFCLLCHVVHWGERVGDALVLIQTILGERLHEMMVPAIWIALVKWCA